MKDQWFGDKKDVFKFGVCLELLKGLGLKKLTWVAMKTEDNRKEHYSELSCVDKELRDFFSDLRKPAKKPKLEMIEDFMQGKGIKCVLVDKYKIFETATRDEYFGFIMNNKDYISNALILVDPDTGFETETMKEKGRASEEHVSFDEVGGIFERMENSILAVFQHQQRGRKYKATFDYVTNQVGNELKQNILCIKNRSAQSLMFIFFKDRHAHDKAKSVLNEKDCFEFVE